MSAVLIPYQHEAVYLPDCTITPSRLTGKTVQTNYLIGFPCVILLLFEMIASAFEKCGSEHARR
jgi:hypothetical protein